MARPFSPAGVACVSALTMALFPATASAQAVVDTYISTNWHTMGQAACLDRAAVAAVSAIAAFSLQNAAPALSETRVLVDTNADVLFWIFCIADNETADIAAANTNRVLVQIIVATTRGNDFGRPLRDHLQACMEGPCPGAAETPPKLPAATPTIPTK